MVTTTCLVVVQRTVKCSHKFHADLPVFAIFLSFDQTQHITLSERAKFVIATNETDGLFASRRSSAVVASFRSEILTV